MSAGLLLAAWLGLLAAAVEPPAVTVVEADAAYRQVRIAVTVEPSDTVAAWEIRVAPETFSDSTDAMLHGRVLVGATGSLERVPPELAFDDCTSDGQPIHRDALQRPIVAPGTTRWTCLLTGMRPGVDQWVGVVPVDAAGMALAPPQPVRARTDVPDVRPAPPDTRPVLLALGSIVVAATVLLVLLRRSDARRGRTRSRLAHPYVAPALIALATLTFYPILYGIGLAFTDADQSRLGDESFIGLANFLTVFTTPGIWRVTGFTMVWAVANTAAHVGLGLLLAIALNRRGLRGKVAYRTILLLPWAIPAYISVLAWNGMLQPDGLINSVLGTQIDFFDDPMAARIVVILVNIWLGVPFMMMTLSGALQALSSDMFEAADVDGVSRWDQFRYLTLPNLKSTMVPVSLLGFIWSFNAFVTIYLLTRGQPYVGFGEPGATDILVTYVFTVAFEYGHYGVAAAWSVAIFLLLVGFSWAYLKQTRATESAA
ncbi:MAG: sugar ABC transporter permease [Pseudomonadota bacterium]